MFVFLTISFLLDSSSKFEKSGKLVLVFLTISFLLGSLFLALLLFEIIFVSLDGAIVTVPWKKVRINSN